MDAAQLHADALVIDGHNDTLVAHIRRGHQSLTGREEGRELRHPTLIRWLRGPLESYHGDEHQIDLPKMRAGGLDAAFFAIDCTVALKNHLAYALDGFGYLINDLAGHPGEMVIARTAADIEAAKANGQLAAVLALENSDGLERSVHVLHAYHALGVRSIGLTHNPRSDVADGALDERDGSGLTHFGVRVVQEMNRLGMVVDIAHVNRRGVADVLELSEKPVLDTHACCRARCDHPRNLDDEQLRALAANGGVVGITYVKSFLREDRQTAGLDDVIAHLDHAVQLIGPEHVGLGSDFDGGGTAIADATAVPRITEALLARGYGETAVRGILGLNYLRVLREVTGK